MKRVILALLALGVAAVSGCGEDRLVHTAMGILKVTVLNAGAQASLVDVTLRCTKDSRDQMVKVARPNTLVEMGDLSPGTCQIRVMTRTSTKAALRSVWVSDLLVVSGRTTEVTVDMADTVVQPVELCNGWDDDGDGQVDKPKEKLLLCSECVNNLESPVADDSRCEVIPCSSYFSYELRGTVANGFTCIKSYLEDITDKRCAGLGNCLPVTEKTCRDQSTRKEDAVASLEAQVLCKKIDGCADQTAPTVANQPDGLDCGTQKWCQAGECVCKPACEGKVCGDDGCGGFCGNCGTDEACSSDGAKCVSTKPETGCADGTREGFQDLNTYPTIASCSGGWSVGGVTRADLVPTCDRKSGNSGQNQAGDGCSAADLCAAGWHVCSGKTEVAAKAGAKGCEESVPAGSPDKSMFFAVAQHSAQFSQCDDTATTGDNDVFGCGNLGIALTADKGCGVLTRALASMKAGSCGYNEAEPGLGPWQCIGGAGSDIHEGGIVAKHGCPNSSCTWNGAPTGNWDRGGVLCCRD
ncbi:MAG: hypothetical protein QM765_06240 [Myxococcales bacterium]